MALALSVTLQESDIFQNYLHFVGYQWHHTPLILKHFLDQRLILAINQNNIIAHTTQFRDSLAFCVSPYKHLRYSSSLAVSKYTLNLFHHYQVMGTH